MHMLIAAWSRDTSKLRATKVYEIIGIYLPETLEKVWIPISQTLRCEVEDSFPRVKDPVSCHNDKLATTEKQAEQRWENAPNIPRERTTFRQGGEGLGNRTKRSLPTSSRWGVFVVWSAHVLLAPKQKLKIDFNFQFLDSVENRKTKPCHRLQHCRRNKIAACFHFSLHCWQD